MLIPYLFVYGTLRRECQHTTNLLLKNNSCYINNGYFYGKLYNVSYYPAAIISDNKNEKVYGELYYLLEPEIIFSQLDEYEECSANFPLPHEYQRLLQTVYLNDNTQKQAWVYCYQYDVSPLMQIITGDYLSHVRMQNK
jgi:gamma-glutamylcyclotransferase (GGCT)/AIG2-like uncharacterized protein YtfP